MIFALLMSAGATCILVGMIPAILILLLPLRAEFIVKLRRRYIATMTSHWFRFATYLTLDFSGTKMYIYSSSPEILSDKGALVISNHRTRLDWMYVGWCYASLLDCASNLIIILKESMRKIPIFGWAMQCLMFVFLSRKREQDLPHIQRVLRYLTAAGMQPSILIFPEGTDLSEPNLLKSSEFAKEHNLPIMKQVLYPKVAGLQASLDCLRGKGLALHDITIAYKDRIFGQRHCEGELIRGNAPNEVHLIVRRYEIDSLPKDKVALEKWLRDVFVEKEKLLTEWYLLDEKSRLEHQGVMANPESWPARLELNVKRQAVEFSWMLMMQACVFLLAALVFSSIFRWIFVSLCVVCVLCTYGGGFDTMELNWLAPFCKPKLNKVDKSD